MPMKIRCANCGRNGRVPDDSIGRNVQCPGCGHRQRLTAADVVTDSAPSGLDILEDEDPTPKGVAGRVRAPQASPVTARPTPAPRPASTPTPPPAPRTAPKPEPDIYEDDEDKSTKAGQPNTLVAGLGVAVGLVIVAILVNQYWNLRPQAETPPDVAPEIAVRVIPPPVQRPKTPPATAPSHDDAAPPVPTSEPDQDAPATTTAAAVPNPPPAAPPRAADATETATAAALPDDGLAPTQPPQTGQAASTLPELKPGAVLSTADIVARSEPSVALITGKLSSGTGFLVEPGILATNSHVIATEFIDNVEIRFPSADEAKKGPLKAKLLFEDAERDLAFLAVETELPALPVAKEYRYRKGEDVTVIGNPGVDGDTILENAISRGVMSTKTVLNGQPYYQLGLAVNPGNSGGPVFDSTGQVIGVVTLRIPGKEELSFCIPAEALRAAIESLRTLPSTQTAQIRSRHRLLATFNSLSRGGTAVGIALELAVAARSNPADEKLRNELKQIDELLAGLGQTLMFHIADEARAARTDPHVPEPARRKILELTDSYTRMKQSFDRTRNEVGVDSVRSLKSTHRRLVNETAALLKIEVPKGVKEGLEDHLVQVQGSRPMMSAVPPDLSIPSARRRILERHGLTPPEFGGSYGPGFGPRPGFSTRPGFPPSLGPRSRYGR